MTTPQFSLRHSVLALALAVSASLASAHTMHVELNTAGLGSSGFLELQFNASQIPAPFASATISHLYGFGDLASATLTGNVKQQSGGFVFGNTTDYNDLFHAVALGGKLSFDVSFSGLPDASSAAIANKFSVSLLGSDGVGGYAFLGKADPLDGTLMSISWQSDSTGVSLSSAITDAGVASISAVPEPTSWAMLGAGLALLGYARRRQQRSAA